MAMKMKHNSGNCETHKAILPSRRCSCFVFLFELRSYVIPVWMWWW